MCICSNLNRFLPCSTLQRVRPKAISKCCVLVGITVLLQLTASTSVVAACLCTYTPATLVKVLDGNTMILEIRGEPTTVHLADIDTPNLEPQNTGTWCEAEGIKALEAMQYANALLKNAKEITLNVETSTDSGELVAVVYVDNVSLGQELLYKNLAIESGEAVPWCD